MSKAELALSSTKIEELRRSSFSNHQIKRYYPTFRSLAEYERILPEFRHKTFTTHIGDMLAQGQEVKVLDIGCGQGTMLAALAQQTRDLDNRRNLTLYGLSAYDYRSQLPTPWHPFIEEVDYRIGDAQQLESVFPDVQFDIIVLVHTLQHLADPLAVTEQTYSILNSL